MKIERISYPDVALKSGAALCEKINEIIRAINKIEERFNTPTPRTNFQKEG